MKNDVICETRICPTCGTDQYVQSDGTCCGQWGHLVDARVLSCGKFIVTPDGEVPILVAGINQIELNAFGKRRE